MTSSRAPTTTSPPPVTRSPSIRACWASLSPGSSPSYAITLLSYSTRRGSLGSSLTSTSMTSPRMQRTSERQWKPAYPTATYACRASACGEPLPDHQVAAHRPLGLASAPFRRYRGMPGSMRPRCFLGPCWSRSSESAFRLVTNARRAEPRLAIYSRWAAKGARAQAGSWATRSG